MLRQLTHQTAAARASLRAPASRLTVSNSSLVTREALARRTYATAPHAPTTSSVLPAAKPVGGAGLPPPPPPKARKSIPRRVLTPLVLLAVAFYGLSIPLGYASLRYRDFLVEAVPLGEQIGDALDKFELSSGKQDPNVKPVPGRPGKETELTRYAENRAKAEGWSLKKGEKADPEKARQELKQKSEAALSKVQQVAADAKAKAGAQLDKAAVEADKAKEKTKAAVKDVAESVKEAVPSASAAKAAVQEKVAAATPRVEEPASTLPVFAQRPRELDATPLPPKQGAPKEKYVGPPLPIGFEPAPGYEVARPPPTPKGDIKPATPPPAPLPLVAPAVKDVTTSEPILGQLASTIDSLAKFVENSSDTVSSSAGSVLTAAQKDITQLAGRLDAIKKAETEKLETQLKKQAGEYSGLLLKAEKELVERLDTQEEDWKKAFDEERKNLVGAYKAKLDKELETQQEIINQRLKEEVVAQGIELQRRWVREVKQRVEQERGGRLAKLEELEGGIRKLEKVTKENEETISEGVRARKLFTAVKAVEHAVASGRPFNAELKALQSLIASQPASADSTSESLLRSALETIPASVSSSGIKSFPALSSHFNQSVAPQLRKVALLPEHGGLFAYLTSVLLSNVVFEKQGWSEGEDVISTVGRARFWLENKDLDMAAREVNSLKGWPKALASDWLKQARSHLEVKQALEVAEGEATAESLRAL